MAERSESRIQETQKYEKEDQVTPQDNAVLSSWRSRSEIEIKIEPAEIDYTLKNK